MPSWEHDGTTFNAYTDPERLNALQCTASQTTGQIQTEMCGTVRYNVADFSRKR